MTYSILKTNGTLVTDLTDGTIDQTSTDLTLIGRNSTNYGLFFNDNFVHLLENFANTTPPNNPITGQLWYDTAQNRLFVHDGSNFKVTGGTLVASSAPSNITTGDLWINSATSQLFFNDGNATVLAGPIYTKSQGTTGFEVAEVIDTSGFNHIILKLYIGNILLGIFSKEKFIPASSISQFTSTCVFTGSQVGTQLTVTGITSGTLSVGQSITGLGVVPGTIITGLGTGSGGLGTYTLSTSATISSTTLTSTLGTVQVGFTAANINNFQFDALAAQASALLASDGSLKTTDSFMSTTSSSSTTGSISIQNDNPLVLGTAGQTTITATNGVLQIKSAMPSQNFQVTLNNGSLIDALFLNATTSRAGVFTATPATTLDVNGTFRINTATPASSTSTGVAGQIAWDSSYLYVCVATNSWKRITLPGTSW